MERWEGDSLENGVAMQRRPLCIYIFFLPSSYLRLFPALCAPESIIIDSCWSWSPDPGKAGVQGLASRLSYRAAPTFASLPLVRWTNRIVGKESKPQPDKRLRACPGGSTRANGIRVIRRSGVVGAGIRWTPIYPFQGKDPQG